MDACHGNHAEGSAQWVALLALPSGGSQSEAQKLVFFSFSFSLKVCSEKKLLCQDQKEKKADIVASKDICNLIVKTNIMTIQQI